MGLSVVTHLTKAIDYEEALFAGLVLLVLFYTQPNYRLATPSLRRFTRFPTRRRVGKRVALFNTTDATRQAARQLTERVGRSPLDYFKLYPDKDLVLFPDRQSFIAYRLAGR